MAVLPVLFFLLLGPFLLFAIWWIVIYNRFVGLRQHLRESWADIEVELRRRLDLIPNLVEVVKGYAAHEQEVLESVARMRAEGASPATAGRRGEEERALEQAAHRLIAVAESYPELKADAHFLRLQEELTETEDRIAASRRFYNANVRDLNELREQFPTSLVAGVMGIERADYFQPDARSATAPRWSDD
ncbi:LemA family protein [Planctomycetes bacterium MalM25]|nr:LemA family protein [Planctomycetes bacterium MalM25]